MRRLASMIIGIAAGTLSILLLYLILRPKGRKRIRLMIETVQEGASSAPAPPTENDDLEVIRGIGPAYARRLNEAGVRTYGDLAEASPSRLEEIIGPRARTADIQAWKKEAKGLA